MTAPGLVRAGEPAGRWVLLATVLGSGVASIDATVVSIALPSIGRDLDAGFAGLQWTVNGYALALASLILLGGSLGDRYGRRRVFVVGVTWFAVASLLCAVAPTIELLVAARVLQGVGGALLTPGSLAIIAASFAPQDRSRAIGAWSGMSGIASAVGPFVGGWLVAGPGWRWIFLINLPLAVVVVLVARRHVPESRDPDAAPHLDVTGAALGALGLGSLTYGLIAAGRHGGPVVPVGITLGVLALVAFVVVERRSPHPMLPPRLFADRQFSAANVVTFLVYAALGVVFFILVLQLQVVAGFSPLLSGTALLPVTVIMLALSARVGALSDQIGPRLLMGFGPIVAAAGLALLLRVGEGSTYVGEVLPGVVVFGFGISLLVAPLTSTVLASAPTRWSGVASAVNNAVARAAAMLAVAVLPVIGGLTGDVASRPADFAVGYRTVLSICIGLLVAGGLLALALIRNPVRARPPAPVPVAEHHHCCAVEGPPLHETEAPAPTGAT